MDDLKSILFVLPATSIGGAETKYFNVIRHLTGIRSVLLTQRAVAGYFSPLEVKTYLFEDFGCDEPMSISVRNTVRYARAIAETAREESAACVAGIMHTGSFYTAVARDIFRMRSAHVGTIEGNLSGYFKSEGRKPTFLEKSLLWYLLRRPSVVVVPSFGVRRDLEEHFGVVEEKINVIYNGTDIVTVRKLAEEKIQPEEDFGGKTIVTACRLNAQKDFQTLLRAFGTVREQTDSRLVIIGDGELRDTILDEAKKLGLGGHVFITGFQRNPFKYIRRADVFVLSSFFEGFGNVIVEAMALGVPVVATDCPSGPDEIIQHGVSGLLVPVKDHGAMAESVLKLLHDRTARELIVENGLLRSEFFGIESMVDGFRSLFSQSCRGEAK